MSRELHVYGWTAFFFFLSFFFFFFFFFSSSSSSSSFFFFFFFFCFFFIIFLACQVRTIFSYAKFPSDFSGLWKCSFTLYLMAGSTSSALTFDCLMQLVRPVVQCDCCWLVIYRPSNMPVHLRGGSTQTSLRAATLR